MASEPLRSFCVCLPLQRFYIGFKLRTLCLNSQFLARWAPLLPSWPCFISSFLLITLISTLNILLFAWFLYCINIVLYKVGVSECQSSLRLFSISLPWYVVFFLSALGALFWTQLSPTRTWLGLSFTPQLSTVSPEGTALRWRHPQEPTCLPIPSIPSFKLRCTSEWKRLPWSQYIEPRLEKELFLSRVCYVSVRQALLTCKASVTECRIPVLSCPSLFGWTAGIIFAFVGYLRRSRISQIWLLAKFSPLTKSCLKTWPHHFLAFTMEIIILILNMYNTYIKESFKIVWFCMKHT